ncbi:MAG: FAD-dependent oxidoreductase [Endomicrobiales bacterium]|nr:FAD-dependent oxidoreductase [Endomicrobiales bacterium]
MYDLIIIGAGPAGITASIYAARKKMNMLVITKDIGGQTNWTASIQNYTGYRLVTGEELVKRFSEQLEQFNVPVKENESVVSVQKSGDVIKVKTDKGEYESISLVVASGRTHRKLGVKGEDEHIGKGVAYCATCDAPVFAGADVAVVGGGNSAVDAALQLAKIAKKVYVIDMARDFIADPLLVDQLKANNNAEIYHDAKVTEILGAQFVSGIKIEQEGRGYEFGVEGIFVEIGSVPSIDFAPAEMKSRRNEIMVNCKSETAIEGIFGAGDVTDVPAKQIIVACGEGAKAALSAYAYVLRKRK